MSDPGRLDMLPETRREILTLIKNKTGATTAEIATHLQISDEGARQHLVHMESQGWIRRQTQRSDVPRSGRPTVQYEMTEEGDNLFPKNYDKLSLTLLEAVVENYGQEALYKTLTTITDKQVQAWEARLQNKSLRERLELLKGFYQKEDAFLTVKEENGDLFIVETNCPIRSVAMKYPQICSTTISTLIRLLGFKIDRVKKFQAEDGRCVFKICQDKPVDPDQFRFELEKDVSLTT
jgi:predicted ArsR family transcriptional regulator